MTSERRLNPRNRVLRKARIVYREGYATMECVVLDLSEGGARLRLGDWLDVPGHFELRIERGPSRMAMVRHRRAGVAGVEFEIEPRG